MNLNQIARILRRRLHGVYISSKMLKDGVLISGDIPQVLTKVGFISIDETWFMNESLIAKWSYNRLTFQEKS